MGTRSTVVFGGLLLITWSGTAAAPSLLAGRMAPGDSEVLEARPSLEWMEPEFDTLPAWEEEPDGRPLATAYKPVDQEPLSVVPEPDVLMLLGLAIAGYAVGRQLMD